VTELTHSSFLCVRCLCSRPRNSQVWISVKGDFSAGSMHSGVCIQIDLARWITYWIGLMLSWMILSLGAKVVFLLTLSKKGFVWGQMTESGNKYAFSGNKFEQIRIPWEQIRFPWERHGNPIQKDWRRRTQKRLRRRAYSNIPWRLIYSDRFRPF
jgi:hypothetical protein